MIDLQRKFDDLVIDTLIEMNPQLLEVLQSSTQSIIHYLQDIGDIDKFIQYYNLRYQKHVQLDEQARLFWTVVW